MGSCTNSEAETMHGTESVMHEVIHDGNALPTAARLAGCRAPPGAPALILIGLFQILTVPHSMFSFAAVTFWDGIYRSI